MTSRFDCLNKILSDLERQSWSFATDFFTSGELLELEEIFSEGFRQASVGKGQDNQVRAEVRGDSIKWLDSRCPPEGLAKAFTFLDELQLELNRRFFLGLKEYEAHLAKYPAGSFYRKHMDRFQKDSSRVLTFIFYLHPQWTDADGGELVLYHQDDQVMKRLLPVPGSLVIFMSGDFPHEVQTCARERRSLTGWIHNRIIS